MRIINIEEKTFEAIISRLDTLSQRAELLHNSGSDKSLKKWLDNQDVCDILNISKRTLQTYRDSGKIAYSQIGYKIYYRPEDVEQLIQKFKNE